jgi:hypothetical protein
MPICLERGCPRLVTRGRCPAHAQAKERTRGTAHQRGFTSHWHNTFKPHFRNLLLEQDIPPVCGATLPTGPQTSDSRCKADGVLTFDSLHHDHEPPLTPHERQHRAAVEDPQRIQLLCAACHAAKTRRQHGGTPGG